MTRGVRGAGLWLAPWFTLLLIGGCASTPPQGVATAPAWMTKPPEERGGVYYQVGMSPKTFRQADGIDRAYEDGVERLAKRLKVDVKSFRLEIETGGKGSGERQERTVTASTEVADLAIYGAEQVESYFDRDGLFGERESTYVLVRWSQSKQQETERLLRKSDPKKQEAERLPKKKKEKP